MKTKGQATKTVIRTGESRSFRVARTGIKDSVDFTNLFSGLIADLAEQKVTAGVANAMCNAGGKVLKMVELEIRYGQHVPGHPNNGRKVLTISGTFEAGLTDGRGKSVNGAIALSEKP